MYAGNELEYGRHVGHKYAGVDYYYYYYCYVIIIIIIIRILLIIGRRCGRRVYEPTSNTASPDYHEKSNSWAPMSMVLRLAALRAAEAPLQLIPQRNALPQLFVS